MKRRKIITFEVKENASIADWFESFSKAHRFNPGFCFNPISYKTSQYYSIPELPSTTTSPYIPYMVTTTPNIIVDSNIEYPYGIYTCTLPAYPNVTFTGTARITSGVTTGYSVLKV